MGKKKHTSKDPSKDPPKAPPKNQPNNPPTKPQKESKANAKSDDSALPEAHGEEALARQIGGLPREVDRPRLMQAQHLSYLIPAREGFISLPVRREDIYAFLIPRCDPYYVYEGPYGSFAAHHENDQFLQVGSLAVLGHQFDVFHTANRVPAKHFLPGPCKAPPAPRRPNVMVEFPPSRRARNDDDASLLNIGPIARSTIYRFLNHVGLERLSITCRALCNEIRHANGVWQRLYVHAFPQGGKLPGGTSAVMAWLSEFGFSYELGRDFIPQLLTREFDINIESGRELFIILRSFLFQTNEYDNDRALLGQLSVAEAHERFRTAFRSTYEQNVSWREQLIARAGEQRISAQQRIALHQERMSHRFWMRCGVHMFAHVNGRNGFNLLEQPKTKLSLDREIVTKMLQRDNDLRLSSEVQARFGDSRTDAIAVAIQVQEQVLSEFGFHAEDDRKDALAIMRAAPAIYGKEMCRIPHYMKFNRARDGELLPGTMVPDANMITPALNRCTLLEYMKNHPHPDRPFLLCAGSYS
jgi:hypothetical protein